MGRMPQLRACRGHKRSHLCGRGLDGSTEATLVCPVTHHCGGSGGRRGTPLMHLQLPHHMNDADVTDVHICTGSYSTRY